MDKPTPIVYLTTQEVARLLNSHADTINNRATKGHIAPAARAGHFRRAMSLWAEDQLPEIARAIAEHAAPGLRRPGHKYARPVRVPGEL